MKKEDYVYIEETLRELALFIRNCRVEQEKEEFKKQFRLIKNDTPLPMQKIVDSKLNNNEKKEETVLTKEQKEMLINVSGVSVNTKPRKDGRYQGYIVTETGKTYVYGKTYSDVVIKINYLYQHGIRKKKTKQKENNSIPTTFNAFAMYYFTNFREKKVSPATFKTDKTRYNKYLAPVLKEKPLKNILPLDCQNIITALSTAGKGKTADEIHCLLSLIFKMAIKHGIISRNPLDIIYHQKHERKHGTALSKNEEKLLKEKLGEKYPFLMVALFTGLRPNEYKTAKIEKDFIIAVNSKRKHNRTEYKKIPIISALKPYIKNGIPTLPKLNELRKVFRNLFPSHRLYDLRTTFYTRCQEYGVSQPAINHYVGHSNGTLANAYTDLSDNFLLTEGKKLDLWHI